MKTILATLLSVALFAGLAGQISAATAASSHTANAVIVAAANEYDYPAFGSQQWWQEQEDQH